MTALTFLRRKYEAGLTDLQAELMLVLAEREMMRLTHLAEEVKRPVSSVGMVVAVLIGNGYVVKDSGYKSAFIYLSNSGRNRVGWLMGREVPSDR